MDDSGKCDDFYFGSLALCYDLPYDTEGDGKLEVDRSFFSDSHGAGMRYMHAIS